MSETKTLERLHDHIVCTLYMVDRWKSRGAEMKLAKKSILPLNGS